jgi:phytoene desaturase
MTIDKHLSPTGHLDRADVVIVGAGPGGLAAAVLLAKSGLRVTVLERSDRVGGRTSTFTSDGFRFDIGPTFFHYPQVLEQIFQEAGADLRREVDLIRIDPFYRLVFGQGGELLARSDIANMENAIALLNPSDARHLRRFLSDTREKLKRFEPFLSTPFLSWRDVFKRDVLRLLPTLKPWRSLDGELRRYFSDPRVRIAFSFQSKYLGMSPFQCPSLFTILSFLEYEYGVFHPVGGCGAITAALERLARRLGVEIRLNESVEEIVFEGRRAVGVRTALGEYGAQALVLNADFARAMQRLVPGALRRNWSDRKIERARFSCSTFMLYLGLRAPLSRLPHHTIYIAKDYAKNLEEIERRHVLSADPSMYVQNACATDPSLAPPGKSTLYVLVPVTHQHPNVDWSRERSRYRALVVRHLEKIGIEDVESLVEYERVLTPDDWDQDFELHRGSTFSLAHIYSQMLHQRPRNRFDDLERVYLVGGSTHPGSGLPVIFQSAKISARLILEDLGVSQSVSVVSDHARGAA